MWTKSGVFLYIVSIIVNIINLSCSSKKTDEPVLLRRLAPEKTGIYFSNDLVKDSLYNLYNFDPFYNGGGVAVGDINNDGLIDVFFTGNMVSSRLYLNKGNLQFEDITESAGIQTKEWARGVAMADVNGDGLLDIYICMSTSANLLFINEGNNTFSERAQAYGLDDKSWSMHAAFFDYDKDGDLDLYLITRSEELLRFANIDPLPKKGESVNTDKLFRNNADNTFTDVTAMAGMDFKGNGLGLVISDINGDSWPDVYVANDQVYSDFLYINNQDGTFTDMAGQYFKHQSLSGMGADIADFNNDGLPDIMVVDMLPENFKGQTLTIGNTLYDRFQLILQKGYLPQYQRNVLQLNSGNQSFSEIGQLAGVDKTDWSWGVLFADLDNDGNKDIIVSNGMPRSLNNLDYIMYDRPNFYKADDEEFKRRFLVEMERLPEVKVGNKAYKNTGNFNFKDVSDIWNFDTPSLSYGIAYADLDNDGDLEIVISNTNDVAHVYENRAVQNGNNFLRVKVEGSDENIKSFGAKVVLYGQGKLQMQEISPFRGYQSTVENIAHFGLGSGKVIDSLVIIWPDGMRKVITEVTPNQLLTVSVSNRIPAIHEIQQKQFFVENNTIKYKHNNEVKVDFKAESLLPHKFTENGPCLAKGDVNGDGLTDFYAGGGLGSTGKLFIQNTDGSFTAKSIDTNTKFDETSALFFDADNDGDLDLYLVSGGNAYNEGSTNYFDRFFENDGNGNFSIRNDLIPQISASGSCVVASDFDGDGWVDLFVGGRVIPQKYPLPASGYLLKNEKGRFRNVTEELCPDLINAGLITDAIWTDFDGDGAIDLIVTGQWMPISFYKNVEGKLVNVTKNSGIENDKGWWQSIVAGDFDDDGDVDYVVGNWGLNSKFKATQERPLTLYAKDFDQNGRIDPVMFYYVKGEKKPVNPRDRLFEQLPGLRRNFPRYINFANAQFSDFFSDEDLKDAYVLEATNLSSSYVENLGDGSFSLKPLVSVAQFAPITAILAEDIDNDGNLDLLLAGNTKATDVNIGNLDALQGVFLKGNGKGEFVEVNILQSGFEAAGIVKSIISIPAKNEMLYLVGQYNDSIKIFSRTTPNERATMINKKF